MRTVRSLAFLSLAVALATSVRAGSQSQQPPSTPRLITIDDYFQIKDVGQPELSPDGQWVAYTVRTKMLKEDKNETRIWMISTHGGDAIPLTAEGVSSGHPRWSPDGKYLAFTSSRNGGKSQIWLLNRLGGEAVRLTDVTQGVGDFEWAPDNTRLVLVIRDPKPEDAEAQANKDADKEKPTKPKTPPPYVIDRLQFKQDTVGYLDRRRDHLYVFDVASKKLTQITSGDFDESQPAWSPDGKKIAFTSNRSQPDPDANRNEDIWVVAADNTDKGAHLTQITTNPGTDSQPTWSPDGSSIAYVTMTDVHLFWYETQKLAVSPSTGGAPKILTTSFDRNARRPRYSADGKYIYFTAEDDGTVNLCRIPAAGGEITRPIGGRVTVGAFSLGKEDTVAVAMATINRPDEIFFLAADAKDAVRLTKTNDALFDQLRLADVEYVRFKSKDGTNVAGYLYKPVGYTPGTRVPTILNPHGGPVGQYSASFYHQAQLFAANGYAVLLPNPRGSSGYGEKFCAAIYADWGGKDYQDDVAMVDYATAQGIADPEKLGVGGWSYGGISTDFIIAQTTRFKAAISGAGVALLTSFWGHDHYQRDYVTELGYPWEHEALWDKLSPFYRVKNITTPTLFMGGDLDSNVPVLGGEQMYQAMKALGRQTELVVYLGEYHGFTTPSHIKDRYERYLAWFAHYVKGDSAPATPPTRQPAPVKAGGE
ncbi:MAG TPA: S9 family peptidase [Candidatus Methylomirabilis sp.]|nr:S9 family peptidase [Candidatus Methylomirabilis sp.]